MSPSTAAAADSDAAVAGFIVGFIDRIVIILLHAVIATRVVSFASFAGFASSKAAILPARHVALGAFRPGTDRDAADDLARGVGCRVRVGVRMVTGSRRPGIFQAGGPVGPRVRVNHLGRGGLRDSTGRDEVCIGLRADVARVRGECRGRSGRVWASC